MLLTIDVGNTNTVFALYKQDQLVESWRLQTERERTGDAYAVFLADCLELAKLKLSAITDVIISSVVPDAHHPLSYFSEKHLKTAAVFVDYQTIGIEIDLETPSEVGADRLVNALAVLHHYQTPAIVIDFGTATTFDVIGQKGIYQGGIIAPGVNLSMSALQQAASKLPEISIQKPGQAIGKNTRDAMKSGVYWGYVSLISGIIDKIKEEIDEEPYILATGGLAHVFQTDLPFIQTIDNDLTLKGLYLAYQNIKANG